MTIPVWHDDAQGTSAIILAGLLGALRHVDKELDTVQIAMLGVGAANTCTAEILMEAGAPPGNIILCDRDGLLYKGRQDLKQMKDDEHEKYDLAILTNEEQRTGDFGEALRGADVCIAASAPQPGLIKKEWIETMAADAIVFACANPLPEIWPWEAKDAGAKVVGTGRSDFANQINNSLGFPAIFRGALDVRATTITDEMCIAAAQALADIAEERGLRDDYVIPSMHEWELYPREAVAVGMKAIEQGVARKEWEEEELLRHATKIIKQSIDVTQSLMDNGFIPKAPQ